MSTSRRGLRRQFNGVEKGISTLLTKVALSDKASQARHDILQRNQQSAFFLSAHARQRIAPPAVDTTQTWKVWLTNWAIHLSLKVVILNLNMHRGPSMPSISMPSSIAWTTTRVAQLKTVAATPTHLKQFRHLRCDFSTRKRSHHSVPGNHDINGQQARVQAISIYMLRRFPSYNGILRDDGGQGSRKKWGQRERYSSYYVILSRLVTQRCRSRLPSVSFISAHSSLPLVNSGGSNVHGQRI